MKTFKKQTKKKSKKYSYAFVVLMLISVFSVLPSFAGQIVYFYHTDAAGTPVAMTDASGTVVWKADYKPFGEEQSVTSNPENNVKFVGKEKDKETGLYYFGARYMDAGTGRFTSVDPKGISEKDLLNPQRLNRYNYSLNNPYRYVDPDGREVRFTSHVVAFGMRHSALQLIPDDQKKNWGSYGFMKDKNGNWYATLSAGPEDGLLKSDINRPTDAPDKNKVEAVIKNPLGNVKEADTKLIESLLNNDKNYKDNLEYVLFPSKENSGYNSNSYTSGLLNSVGAESPNLKGTFPGMDKPVLKENFK